MSGKGPPQDEVAFDPEEGPYDSGLLVSVTSPLTSLAPLDSGRPGGARQDPPGGDDERPGGKRGEAPEQERNDSAYGSSSITDSLLGSCTGEPPKELALGDPKPEVPGPDPLQVLAFISEDGDTLLHLAIIHSALGLCLDILSLIPTEMAEVQNDLFQTPLHLAVYLNQTEVARALVQKGVNLELQDRNGNTPLHVACEQENLDCAHVLLQKDGPPESCRTSEPRQWPNLQLQNWQGLACLHIATLKRNGSLVALLLKREADINVKEGTSGKTPLHLAVELRDRPMVSLLLRRGAQVDATMFNGCTPLHLAVGRKDATIASLLCQSGADTLLRNVEDETAQDLADGNNDLLALLPFDDLKISGKPVVCKE
ncbi:NF-kappa-B inhibitor epsilon [Ambystoma mexicanum]|uniref:NF-kappa-B inhibitor epsilon n=1 Tax=Ambystoma mexicanum TaxID=8296 RepID=UPI0037E89C38